MPTDPNLVTAETAIKAPKAEDAKDTAPAAIEPGTVLKKGAPPPAPKAGTAQEEMITVRITKAGHGEVHDGKDGRYDWNDEVVLPRSVGESLEGRHYAEIQ